MFYKIKGIDYLMENQFLLNVFKNILSTNKKKEKQKSVMKTTN